MTCCLRPATRSPACCASHFSECVSTGCSSLPRPDAPPGFVICAVHEVAGPLKPESDSSSFEPSSYQTEIASMLCSASDDSGTTTTISPTASLHAL